MRSVQMEVWLGNSRLMCGLALKAGQARPLRSEKRCVLEKTSLRDRRGTEDSVCGDVVQTVSSVHVHAERGQRVPQPCLPARSGPAPATAAVLRRPPHAKLYGLGVFFLWPVVGCSLLTGLL